MIEAIDQKAQTERAKKKVFSSEVEEQKQDWSKKKEIRAVARE